MNDVVQVALRALVTKPDEQPKPPRRRRAHKRWPQWVLAFDTETSTDPTQRLLFGSYQIGTWDGVQLSIVEEGLFYADELPERDPKGFEKLTRYVHRHKARVGRECDPVLQLMSRREFVDDVFWRMAYQVRALVVGFNLPFDLSRLAVDVGAARGRYLRGFSFTLWEYFDGDRYRPHPYRPHVACRVLDSKRAFIGFTRPWQDHPDDAIDEDSSQPKQPFRGRFLDLRTLAFALTNESHSLDSACTDFDVSVGKGQVQAHGRITASYIDYNRRDVQATLGLLEKLRAEFDRHPIQLRPWQAFSPASIAKAYLTAMGVRPLAEKYANIGAEDHAMAMMAYYGGRAEARIRRRIVPVIYCDFLSMYPTVNALLGLWDMLTAKDLVLQDATYDIQALLERLTLDACFDRDQWRELTFYAQVEASDDILPLRARYDPASRQYGIGLNRVTSDEPLWYAGPDIVASTLLTGRPPTIIRAVRLAPRNRQSKMRSVKLRGSIPVSPYRDDFFQKVIETRKALKENDSMCPTERNRLDLFLKVLANSGSYGVFVEMNREELPVGSRSAVTVHGLDGAFEGQSTAPESAGEFCFPLVGALITAGARLMLAMLERCVTDACGTFAFCDTDSMAIVAAQEEATLRCPGGTERTRDGHDVIRVLSRTTVHTIIDRFGDLNPYDRDIVPGSILEMEKENFNPETRQPQQLYAFVISAKRYALFNQSVDGDIRIRKASEHGLGHILHPTGHDQWIQDVWFYLIADALGLDASLPEWSALPAVSRITITSPHVYRPFDRDRHQLPYADRIKPLNFVLSATLARLGQPVGINPNRFHLIGPFSPDPATWLNMEWFDLYSRESYYVTTSLVDDPARPVVKSLGQLVEEYRLHPEPKSADRHGHPCDEQTVGLLHRRRVYVGDIVYIGKESNRVEDVQSGLVHDLADVLEVHVDPRRDLWHAVVQPLVRVLPRKPLAVSAGLSVRQIQRLRQGKSRPSQAVLARLALAAHEAAERIVQDGTPKAALAAAKQVCRSLRVQRLVEYAQVHRVNQSTLRGVP